MTSSPGLEWWRNRCHLFRYLCDLVAGELMRLRPGSRRLPTSSWTEATGLDTELDMDSLERLSVGAILAEAVHLHASGIEDHLLTRHTLGEWQQTVAEGLGRYSARLTFQTSGSTGDPKACTHLLTSLEEEVQALAGLFTGCRRIVSAVPSHHIYGFLFTILLPQALGIAGVETVEARESSPAALAGALREGDLIVGHPAFWQSFLRAVPVIPAGVTGVTSTAPCPDELALGLARAGLQRLVQVYGSSETAGVGWRMLPDAPYRLFPYWRHAAEDDAGHGWLERTTPEGIVTAEYPDALEWQGDDRFIVCKRRDGAVQVGGVNVFPARVREVLLAHSLVVDAAVRLMRPDEGSRLKAFVVPRTGHGLTKPAMTAELTHWIAERLPVAERPKSFTFGARLPVTDSGKAADWIIAADEDLPA